MFHFEVRSQRRVQSAGLFHLLYHEKPDAPFLSRYCFVYSWDWQDGECIGKKSGEKIEALVKIEKA